MDFLIDVRSRVLRAGCVILLGCCARSVLAESLTLEQAWAMAERGNPGLQTIRGRLPAALGEQAEGRALLFNNPQLSVASGPRHIREGAGANGTTYDWSVGLSQTFEIAGQRGARRDATDRIVEAAHQDIEEGRRQLRADVERRFIEVLSLQTRSAIEERSVALMDNTVQIVKRRVVVGEDSKLDGNLTLVEAERVRNDLAVLQEQLVQTRASLAALLQISPPGLPEVEGSLEPRPARYRLDELLAAAAQRPGVRALQLKESAARRRLDLERAARYPDITLGLTQIKEGTLGGQNLISLVSVSIPLPMFKQNDAGIGRAATELTQASIERASAARNARADVVALWDRREKLMARVARLQDLVLPTLEENQKLSQKSLTSGAIGLSVWILAQRQVLEGQRELVEARAALRQVQVDLEAAAGIDGGPPVLPR